MVRLSIRDKLDGNDLDLSLLNLTEVPVRDIEALPKATNIDLSNNQLTSLPNSFAPALKNITRLDLGSNKLKSLPENIQLLQNLTHLDLYNNQLTDLPVTFCQLRKLKWLDLKGNHLNPALRKAAGDCLNRKECEAAARNVVGFLKHRFVQKENERLESLKKEQEMENARKQAEEKQSKKMKETEKKAAKEKKKQQANADNVKAKVEANGRAPAEKVPESKLKRRERKPKKGGKKSSSIGWMNWLLTLFLLGALAGGFYLYTGGDFSEKGLNAAYTKLVDNSQTLANITVEAFQSENLKEVAQTVSSNVVQSCAAAWATLEQYTGDLSPYTTPVIEIASQVFEWLKVKAILCYDWICDNVDWAAIWEAIRSAVKYLYEQCLFLYEELNKNETFLSAVETIKAYTASLLDFLYMLWVALCKQIGIAIEYIKDEGPGVLAAVKEQASGALHAAKQSFEGLIK